MTEDFKEALQRRDELIDEMINAVRDMIYFDYVDEERLRDIANNLFFAGYNCDD